MAETTKRKPRARKPKTCSRCEQQLDEEERANPQKDGDDVICDECYCELFHFECCLCCECGHVDDQHNMIVVFEPDEAFDEDGRPAGVYAVTGCPYYGGSMLGGHLFARHLSWIAPIPSRTHGASTERYYATGNGHPCGHLCLECQAIPLAYLAERPLERIARGFGAIAGEWQTGWLDPKPDKIAEGYGKASWPH
jgi:hypothetical protein